MDMALLFCLSFAGKKQLIATSQITIKKDNDYVPQQVSLKNLQGLFGDDKILLQNFAQPETQYIYHQSPKTGYSYMVRNDYI